jgi:tRNA modification GTPase
MTDRPEAQADTIVALASGRPPAAIAVIRLSGPAAASCLEALSGRVPPPRRASLTRFRNPRSGEILDEGIALFLPGPASPTGEDGAEFHVHGGRAVVAAMLAALTALPGVRLAEPGEFTRRAFYAGRMDLAAVEGLADLVAADTEVQRRQALAQASGVLGARVGGWRNRILAARALAEASLDFADEDDVAADALEQARAEASALRDEIAAALVASTGGERLREGFRVVVLGPPNAGKSSLVNALARREVAIVTEEAGTTRDLIEVHLDLRGFPVVVTDTAGLREAAGRVEAEGIRRARSRAEEADLVLWLSPADAPEAPPHDLPMAPMIVVRTKADLFTAGADAPTGGTNSVSANSHEAPEISPLLPAEGGEKVPEGRMRAARAGAPETVAPAASAPPERHGPHLALRATLSRLAPGEGTETMQGAATRKGPWGDGSETRFAQAPLPISTHTGSGLAELVALIAERAAASLAGGEAAVLVRARHREAAEAALAALDRATAHAVSPELAAEDLRLASDALGRIVGAVGVEDVLGHIFSAFCIGK